jgi:hypothetical protein
MIKEKFPIKKDFLIGSAIIFVFSLVCLSWFGGDYALGQGDNFLSINLSRYLLNLNSSWNGMQNTGYYEFGLGTLLPYSLVYLPLYVLGFGNVVVEKIWMVLSLFLPGLFMYIFLRVFWERQVPDIIKVAASLLYIFNPITLLFPYGTSTTKFSVYMALPLLAYFLIRIFDESRLDRQIKFGVLFAFSTMLLSGSLVNIPENAAVFIVLLALFAYKFFAASNKKSLIIVFLVAFLLSVGLNFWLLYSSFYSQVAKRQELTQTLGDFTASEGTFNFDALRLFGFWALNLGFEKVPYYSFGSYYYSLPGVLSTYVVCVLAFAPLIFIHLSRRRNAKVLLFLFLGLLGVFLVKGAKEPYGSWFSNLYETYSLFRVFREPFAKFSLVSLFAFVGLISYSLSYISKLFESKYPQSAFAIAGVFGVLIIFMYYPMFTGEMIGNYTYGRTKQMRVEVPEYWEDLYAYSVSEGFNGRVLTMPQNWYYAKSYVWRSGMVGVPFDLYLKANSLFRREQLALNKGDLVIAKMYDAVHLYNKTGDTSNLNVFMNLARILNTESILQMNDFDWISFGEFFEPWALESMEKFYGDLGDYIVPKKDFGEFTLDYLMSIPHIVGGENIYRFEGDPTPEDYINVLLNKKALHLYDISSEYYLEKIYTPDYLIKANSLSDMLLVLSDSTVLEKRPLFVTSGVDIESNVDTPDVSFEKISESRYQVFLPKESWASTYLVFSETFDENWVLGTDCSWFLCNGYLEVPHFEANQFGNGWLLKAKDIKGDLYILHKSEFRLKYGVLVSFGFCALGVATYIFSKKISERFVEE